MVAAWRCSPQLLGILAALAFVLLAMPLASQAHPLLLPRTLAFSIALVMILLAAGAVAVSNGWLRAVTALLLLEPGLRGTADYFAYGGEHQPFRETVALLGRSVEPGEPLIVTDAFDAVAIEHYGSRRPVRLVAAVDPGVRLEREAVRLMTSAILVEPSAPCGALGREPRVWVLAYPNSGPGSPRRLWRRLPLRVGRRPGSRLSRPSFGASCVGTASIAKSLHDPSPYAWCTQTCTGAGPPGATLATCLL